MRENKDNNSLKDLTLTGKIIVISSLTLLIIFAIIFPIGIYFFGFAGLFSLSDVPYTSLSLLGFVIIFSILSIFLELVAKALIEVSTQYIKNIYKSFIIRMLIYCTFTWVCINAADELINALTIPLKIELVAAFLDFILEDVTKDKNAKVRRVLD
ncbi:regulatory protein YrvL [Bacillus oleivorans]|uniref:Regulatory protein YrvL n=1 Tax=Bacillus oleivorans TaxID=1448271 RepID=A0A285CM96_9BACI|nr:YrvL family regulatory protein [Bacillus oleivorans]SNX68669.1 regulatory protein YrvL [Bacillus oleivorans]